MDQAAPALSPDLRIGSLLSRSWRAFRTRPWFLAGITAYHLFLFVCLGLGIGLLQGFGGIAHDPALSARAVRQVMDIATALLAYLFNAGGIYICMRVWVGDQARFGMYFIFLPKIWKLLGLYLLHVLAGFFASFLFILCSALTLALAGLWATALPVLLFGIPAVYLTVAFGPAYVVLLETDLGVFPALRLAWRLTRGRRGGLLLAALASALVCVLGVLGLGVGLLATWPLSQLMLVGAYEELVQAYTRQAAHASRPGD